MDINKTKNGETLELALVGRLDTSTAPALEEVVNAEVENTKELIFEFKNLEYISSAGLRVLLACQKKMNAAGKMVIKNVSEDIMEVFDITGFSDILNIE